MMRLSLVIALLLSWPALANGEGVLRCFPRETVMKLAQEKYGEQPIARGVDSQGWLAELFSTEDGSTWTFMVSPPDGKSSCLLSAGDGWQSLSPEWKAKGDPL